MAGALDYQDWSREELAELAGWTVYREARKWVNAGAVRDLEWDHPVLQGSVTTNEGSYHPVFDLRSHVFPVNRCDCAVGRRRQVCAHAVAICLAFQQPKPVGKAAAPTEPVAEPTAHGALVGPQSLRLANGGEPLSFRLTLPPNLEAAVERNAIVIKLEYATAGKVVTPEKSGKTVVYTLSPEGEAFLKLVEDWCGGTPFSLLQLKTPQLLELLRTGATVEYFKAGQAEPIPTNEVVEKILPMIEKAAEKFHPAAKKKVRRAGPSAASAAGSPPRQILPGNWLVVDGSSQYLAILIRDREHLQYRGCVDWLRSEGFRKEPSNGKWWLRDAHKVLNFLASKRPRLERNYDVGYTDNFRERTQSVVPLPLVTETESRGEDYTLRMELKAEGLDIAEVRRALATGRHYIKGPEIIYLIEAETIERLESATRSLGNSFGMPMTGSFEIRLRRADLVHAESVLDDLEIEAELPEDWKQRSTAIREVGQLAEPPLPESLRSRLRTYQLLGVAWLWHLYRNRLGGILADEMGLGKTIQAIALLTSWRRAGERSCPSLVVAPAGLLGNWLRELKMWAPELRTYLHHGPDRLTEFPDTFPADVCLTSYGTLRNDRELLQSQSYSLIIADEAQHVKNRRSHASRSLRALAADAKFILTGTPIENSIDDLRSLFEFCLPGYLRRALPDMRGEERQAHDQQQVSRAAPYILRRAKKMVAPELPDKIEQTIWCGLGAGQRSMYQQIREKTEQTLLQMADAGASENKLRFAMLTELLRLRQVCADPGMLNAEYPLEESSKFMAFRELLQEAMDGGHRVLVFSQFVTLLRRLEGWLKEESIGYAYIDGATRDRLKVCERFNSDTSQALCLISLKAGGTGLNLTGADTVVHFDPWWNPAVEDQATDRAHRIGQTRTVTSYKLVTESTVEEKVVELQLKKSALLRDLLDESSLQSAKVDLSTLKSLLSD
jgi:superfamily II DNA or RNA helicase